MSELMLEFLQGRITDQLMTLYMRAGGLIEFFEKDDQYDLIEEMLMNIDNLEHLQVLDTIYLFHTSILTNIINEYGISLQDDVSTLEDLIKLIESLLYLEDHEDRSSISGIIEGNEGDSAESTLSELLSFASIYPVEDFLLIIKRINPAILTKLIKEEIGDIYEKIADKEVIKKLRKIKDYPLVARSDTLKLIKTGLSTGLDFNLYLRLFKEYLFQDYKTEDEIAVEIYLLHFISKSEQDITQLINERVVDYIGDPLKTASVSAQARRISVELSRG